MRDKPKTIKKKEKALIFLGPIFLSCSKYLSKLLEKK